MQPRLFILHRFEPLACSAVISMEKIMSPTPAYSMPKTADPDRFNIRFPEGENEFQQDDEWFEFDHDGQTKRFRVHDYAGLYNIPGLYEALVYKALKCSSPTRVTDLLVNVLKDWPMGATDLRILDLGAGNGIVGEILKRAGAEAVVGLDLLPEAKISTERDRPDVYDDYVVADLTALSREDEQRIRQYKLNCLTTVAALGFSDIPPLAFATAFNLLDEKGWMAITIKEDFLDRNDDSGFCRLIRAMIDHGIVEPQAHHRYCHRTSVTGEQLFYIALICRKTRHIPDEIVEAAESGTEASIKTRHSKETPVLIGK